MNQWIAAAALAVCAQVSWAANDVGTIEFPTSTESARAQAHFERGATILHSFGWKQAITEFQAAQERILSQVSTLQVPLLLMHGGGDRITSPAGSATFFETLPKGDRQFIQYPHAYHELHLDLNQDQVLQDMLNWMLERI